MGDNFGSSGQTQGVNVKVAKMTVKHQQKIYRRGTIFQKESDASDNQDPGDASLPSVFCCCCFF